MDRYTLAVACYIYFYCCCCYCCCCCCCCCFKTGAHKDSLKGHLLVSLSWTFGQSSNCGQVIAWFIIYFLKMVKIIFGSIAPNVFANQGQHRGALKLEKESHHTPFVGRSRSMLVVFIFNFKNSRN